MPEFLPVLRGSLAVFFSENSVEKVEVFVSGLPGDRINFHIRILEQKPRFQQSCLISQTDEGLVGEALDHFA